MWVSPFNPTAENMAEWILKEVAPMVLKGTGVTVYHVELYETENCKADAKL
jgi:6-pyruvoyltetrahydropterin/6-carboxytetrahydropterin synthase